MSAKVNDAVQPLVGLADVRGGAPEDLNYPPDVQPLPTVWVTLRANLRAVVEGVTIADVATDRRPAIPGELVGHPSAWVRHGEAHQA